MDLFFAASFLAGSVLSLVLPVGLLISLAVWFTIAARRVPEDTPASSSTLPPDAVVEAAGPAVVADVTPADPPADQP